MYNKLLAADTEITNPVLGDLGKKTGIAFFQELIPGLVGLSLIAGTIIFFFILTLGAIQWITGGGDKQSIEAARGKITNAIIGIIILFSTYAVLSLVETFFNIDIMTLDIGPLVT
jgi:hypothetical protein